MNIKILNSAYEDTEKFSLNTDKEEEVEASKHRFKKPSFHKLVKKHKSLSSKPKKRSLPVKFLRLFSKTLVVVVFFLFAVAILGLYSFLRYRQLCTYQQLVSQNKLINNAQNNLCPNIISTEDWGTILKNAFDFSILGNLQVNAASNGFGGTGDTEECDDPLSPICWIKGTKPELKQTDGYTNLLMVGLDSRTSGGLKNTDSIMLVSMHNASGRILLTSFPRDLHVYYKRPNGYQVNGKINAIYANDGVQGLNYAIEQISGKKVHYYAYIRFDTFLKVIDKLGGVDINLPEKFGDVYPCSEVPEGRTCPNPRFVENGMYGYFEFPAGQNHFDSFQALVYARARKYSSDYARARRQQEIFKAVLNNALKQEVGLSERINNYIEMYNIFKSEVQTNIGTNEIAGVVSMIDRLSDQVARVVADPQLGGFNKIIYTTQNPNGNGGVQMFRDRTHKAFQNHLSGIWSYLPYYIEQPKVLIINASGADIPKDSPLGKLISANPYWKPKVVKQDETVVGIRIYDMSGNTKAGSLRDIQSRVTGSLIFNAEIDEIVKSDYKEDIVIIYGKQDVESIQ